MSSNRFYTCSWTCKLPHKLGKVEFITGTMFAGKSEELLSRIAYHENNSAQVLVIKHTKDTRYEKAEIVTHNSLYRHWAIPVTDLSDIPDELIEDSDVIAIDEIHFFANANEILDSWAFRGKRVIATGLASTLHRNNFTNSIFAVADEIVFKTALCNVCRRNPGTCNVLLKDIPDIPKLNIGCVELIGGEEMWQVVCRRCYISNTVA